MSTKYPGGIISKTAPTPSGPYSTDTAPGIWTLEQQAYWQKLGQWPTAGNVNPNAFIENLFQTYLYTGTGAAQTITNGVNLSANGGLVWIKDRTQAYDNGLFDTTRGAGYRIISNSTATENFSLNYVSSFNSTGFSLGSPSVSTNASGDNYVSWTFRKQAKFFDVVTWTGDGVAGRQISHSLGSAPGAILVKNTNDTRDWAVWHNTLADGTYLKLNTTDSVITNTSFQVFGNASGQTSTYFTVGQSGSGVNGLTNASSATYVAYLFADDAGGFGLSGTENVISCGSFTTDSSWNATVNLGYEPQFILFKSTSYVDNWYTVDTMRGWSVVGGENYVSPNLANAEANYSAGGNPTATGFQINTGNPNSTYIYVAIRRGPMAVPTLGTSVFDPEAYTGTSAARTITSGFPVDLSISKIRSQNYPGGWFDRLRGALQVIRSSSTDPEATSADSLTGFDSNTGVILGGGGGGRINTSPDTYAMWNFRRAPGFMDEVCYTGTGSARTVAHNLTVAPELIIVKTRSSSGVNWSCYHSALGNTQVISLNEDIQAYTSTQWNNTTPTSSVFSVGTQDNVNGSAKTYVAYLFATCAGVSKVGSYTGTGTTQQVNCGFTGGARFVLIKRTDEVASGNPWYVWDSARGIVAGNDPYLLMNATDPEVTGTDYVDTYSAGFEISSTAPSAINANGGTFIFLAIA